MEQNNVLVTPTILFGMVATTPRHLTTSEGLPITSFRLAETYIRPRTKPEEEHTNWYTITTFNQLALNTIGSISKGDRVFAIGQLNIRDWENGERSGTTIELDAISVGLDMRFHVGMQSRSLNGEVPLS